ncbi:hypothetical protein BX600DRAFT_461912 [Xylariales sp. PMI_506]|nr:hypothetical protein BX600DRAFT_461912 [Xylariales sp. PMI_506]
MPSKFKAIIVGGGPVGLVAAHTLAAAGLDFVLLERRITLTPPFAGVGLGIFPHSLRVLDQLGLLPQLEKAKSIMNRTSTIDHQGVLYNVSKGSAWCEENHGRHVWFAYRGELLRILYDGLSPEDQAKIKTGKGVVDIEDTGNSVKVTCADGSVEEGSIVIGADGVHSAVRGIMRKRALEENPEATVNDELPFVSTFKVMWGSFPIIQGLNPEEGWDCRGSGYSSQLFVGRERGWFLLYELLDEPTKESRRYNEADMEEYAAKHAETPLTDTLRFKDIKAVSENYGMSDLAEGLLKTFSWNRVVLVGDAVNKQTPNVGLGFNSGVQDVVALTNRLKKLVEKSGEETLSTKAIKTLFYDHETARREDASRCLKVSAGGTRIHTWNNWVFWIMDRYVVPWAGLGRRLFESRMAEILSQGLILDFKKEKTASVGKIPWLYHS